MSAKDRTRCTSTFGNLVLNNVSIGLTDKFSEGEKNILLAPFVVDNSSFKDSWVKVL